MRTTLLSLFCALVVTVGSAPAGEIKIGWYGQSMFQIVTPKGLRIVLDPQNLDAYRVPMLKADLVLMTHLHNDHTRVEQIENIKEAKQYNALKQSSPLVTDWNVIDEKLKDVRFFCVPTFHDQMNGLLRGKNGCWVMDVDGIRIVHLGDLGHMLNKVQLKKLGKVDVLMVPVGGVYTLNALDAYKVCEQIKPSRWIIPMHYGTVVYDDLLPLTYFRDECKDNNVPIDVFKPKEWLKIDTRAAAPKQVRVGVLNYLGPGGPEITIKVKDKGKDKDKDKK